MIADWWGDFRVEGFAGFRLCSKFKMLKAKINQWKIQFLSLRQNETANLLSSLQQIDADIEDG
ncbi:hypothetical protein PJP07_30790, partial [Mycobacterium kansasii]